ncbi:MAG: M28 family peptidase [Candidatus Heimdallarchaeota archaeon]|nr:M28 family peptidase [Candidatus Heimdallarchaeota archaeon]
MRLLGRKAWIQAILSIVIIVYASTIPSISADLRAESPINSASIRNYLQDQIDLGPRIPGTQASLDFSTWLHDTVNSTKWQITTQNYTISDIELRNYWITKAGEPITDYPEYIIGAHYDSRLHADKECGKSTDCAPVPGANDGASGVAGILELMKHIPDELASHIGFVLFDAEDQGGLTLNNDLWGWIWGSEYFVDQMSTEQIDATKAFVLFDMIADDDFRLPFEPNSDSNLVAEIWGMADQLGYGSIFVEEPGTGLIDDHIPFRNVGIPSIDIIDFTYPEHHTTLDDMDHVSEVSVAIVVDVILAWLILDVATTLSLTNDYSSLLSTDQPPSRTSTTNGSVISTKESDSNYLPFVLIGSSIFVLVIMRFLISSKNR